MYEKNPRSRVFAPLAEAYRKLGMIDESLKVLKEGLKYHSSYTLAYIVLGQCYYDLEKYELAYNTVRSFTADNLENITLQKLFAQTCMHLGHLEESLHTFKHILLLNPKDKFVAEKIKLLEDDLLIENNQEEINESDSGSYSQDIYNEDDWVQVNFGQKSDVLASEEIEVEKDEDISSEVDDWSMEKDSTLEKFKNEVKEQKLEIKQYQLDDEYFHEDYDNESDDVITELEDKELDDKTDTPIITHTLVNLYMNQGHYEKAKAILEDILKLHPNDSATQRKLNEVKTKANEDINGVDEAELTVSPVPVVEEILNTEEDGQEVLTSLLESTIDTENSKYNKVEEAFYQFTSELNKRNSEINSPQK